MLKKKGASSVGAWIFSGNAAANAGSSEIEATFS